MVIEVDYINGDKMSYHKIVKWETKQTRNGKMFIVTQAGLKQRTIRMKGVKEIRIIRLGVEVDDKR